MGVRSEGEGGLMGIKKGIIGALMMVTTGSAGSNTEYGIRSVRWICLLSRGI